MTVIEERDADPLTGWVRVAIGLVQGLLAWVLIENADSAFALHNPGVYAAVTLLVAFPPLIVLGGLGRMRARSLAIWTAAAALILVGLVIYDLWREPFESGARLRIWPSPQLLCLAAAGLYIAHHLIEPADVERRLFASYRERFESAWRHGFQLVLSLAFTLVFWGVLHLGAALFDMIGIKALSEVLKKSWFVSPALAVAFAAAVHLTDVRPGLIRGVRTVGLTLLSWLLPLMAGLAAVFLLALVFTGVEPLWATRRAAGILLSATAALIILINAVYQDGEAPQTRPLVLRWAVRGASVILVPLTALAAWANALRIGQYGLTPERVSGVMILVVAAVYALGYAWAAIDRGTWMRRLETVNVAAAVVILAVMLAALSPIADPARLSARDQAHRLTSGKTPVARFDFDFLRFDAARFGREALDRLAKSPDPAIAREAAEAAKRTERRYRAEPVGGEGRPPFSGAVVRPAGAVLPESLRRQVFEDFRIGGARCLVSGEACEIHMLDVTGDGAPEALVATDLIEKSSRVGRTMEVFAQGPDGVWKRIGAYDGYSCPGVAEALAKAPAIVLPPAVRNLRIGAQTLPFSATYDCVRPPAPVPSPAPKPSAPPSELGPAFQKK